MPHLFAGKPKTDKKYQALLISSASILVLLMLITPLEYSFLIQKAYADGLSVENLPPASVGNRQLSLYLKVNPPILTTAASHSAYMQFRLFNAANNQTI
ncbi:MAG TPA: hypothetical protein VEL11_16550, partial [Candidatus Bathyarchaeia archaeon]|nr:hypothetical protein [Candidatus Bathyarchaeia archaeon]